MLAIIFCDPIKMFEWIVLICKNQVELRIMQCISAELHTQTRGVSLSSDCGLKFYRLI